MTAPSEKYSSYAPACLMVGMAKILQTSMPQRKQIYTLFVASKNTYFGLFVFFLGREVGVKRLPLLLKTQVYSHMITMALYTSLYNF